jgi:hypothetical protein
MKIKMYTGEIVNTEIKFLVIIIHVVDFFNKQLSKRCLVGMSQTVIFMIIRLVTLSVNIFLCN